MIDCAPLHKRRYYSEKRAVWEGTIFAPVIRKTDADVAPRSPAAAPTRTPVASSGTIGQGDVQGLRLVRWLWHPSTIGAICVSVVMLSLLAYLREPLASLGGSSYAGILLVGLIAGIIAALGGLIGYVLGARKAKDVQNGPVCARSLRITRRWIGPSLFTFAILTGPFMVTSLLAGATHYPLWRFLLYVTAGKVVKLTGFAFVGYHTLPWLFRPLA